MRLVWGGLKTMFDYEMVVQELQHMSMPYILI